MERHDPRNEGAKDSTRQRRAKGSSSARSLRRLFFALWILAAPVVLAEVAARALTREDQGIKTLFGVDLVPIPLPTPRQREGLARSVSQLPYLIPDAELGWTIRPLGASPDGLYEADAEGARILFRGETPAPAERDEELWIFGDSLAHGDELAAEATWAAHLQRALEGRLRVRNFAVPGYGTDQAILRLDQKLRQGTAPRVAVLTFYSRNLIRAMTFARPFHYPRSGIPWLKPRLSFGAEGAEKLLLSPVPPPSEQAAWMEAFKDSPLRAEDGIFSVELYEPSRLWGRLGTWIDSAARLRRFSERQERLIRDPDLGPKLARNLAEAFIARCQKAGIEPYLFVIGDAMDVQTYEDPKGTAQPMIQALNSASRFPIDGLSVLHAETPAGEDPAAHWFVGGRGHPNALAAERLARVLLVALRDR